MDNHRYPDKFGARKAAHNSLVNHFAPPSLSEQELARLREISDLHFKLLPEFEPFLKALYRVGLIEGRRALVTVQKMDADPPDDSPGVASVDTL